MICPPLALRPPFARLLQLECITVRAAGDCMQVPKEVIRYVDREVIKEVPVEKIKEVEVIKYVDREVIKEVPVQVVREVEVIREVRMQSAQRVVACSGSVAEAN